ncbi:hypothetical protein KFE25_012656 [Diacronema lutheri]|uniref:Protein kinase domain-containing protein n=1 Tax=Diacronema lutheri TaxID=2081491 RepID=A0A8J6C5A8_DIALT|nr:hypothetical protein KFE25_012656 [Diacronema lutheri]
MASSSAPPPRDEPVSVSSGPPNPPKGTDWTFVNDKAIGSGSFGTVYMAIVAETGKQVAVKKVLQDKRFKNRELQIMKMLDHANVTVLHHNFYSEGDKPDETYLNLVMDFMPQTVYSTLRQHTKAKKSLPLPVVKLYAYQLFRSLAYIHSLGICHRDIKPQNLLVDPETGVLKLCDFGSAKILVRGEPNVAYICSRYYRAPELIFGATAYSVAIDVWSVGCVVAELLLGTPLFPGESGVDQLVEIIKVLGTPTLDEIQSMNPNYTEYKFPQVKAYPWPKVFRPRTPVEAIDLVSRLLRYSPEVRLKPLEACAAPLFDELRDDELKLPSGRPPPPLFDFKPQELFEYPPTLRKKLIPEWYSKRAAATTAAATAGGAAGGGGGGAAATTAPPAAPTPS